MNIQTAAVRALPWLSTAGAILMPSIAAKQWKSLHTIDRAAYVLDTVAYTAAIGPLFATRREGWWIVYCATIAQIGLAAVEVAQPEPPWSRAAGRTVGVVALVPVLSSIRKAYR